MIVIGSNITNDLVLRKWLNLVGNMFIPYEEVTDNKAVIEMRNKYRTERGFDSITTCLNTNKFSKSTLYQLYADIIKYENIYGDNSDR